MFAIQYNAMCVLTILIIASPVYLCCDVTPRCPPVAGADLDNVLQCSMRMSARSNPPTSPQYALAPPGPAKCLDISTVRWDKHTFNQTDLSSWFSVSPTPTDGLEDIPEDNSIGSQHKIVPKFSKTSTKEFGHRVSSAPSQWGATNGILVTVPFTSF